MPGHVTSPSPKPDVRSYAAPSLGYALFATRWLQAPLYFGLVAAQGVYVYKFFNELWRLIQHIVSGQADETHVMLAVLKLVDVVMIANLLIMVIVGGYETFVSRIGLQGHRDQPEWLSHVNSNVLKVKLATAIVGISSVHLLQMFVDVDHTSEHSLLWGTVIHMAFIVSAAILAYMSGPMEAVRAYRSHGGYGGRGPSHGESIASLIPPQQTAERRTAAERAAPEEFTAPTVAGLPGPAAAPAGHTSALPAPGLLAPALSAPSVPAGPVTGAPASGGSAAAHDTSGAEASGAQRRVRAAGFPSARTLEEFDCGPRTPLDWETVARLGKLEFITGGENLVLVGPPGTGKTHLATALGIRACQAGHGVLFAGAAEWAARLADAEAAGRLTEELARLDDYPLLVIDEVGYLPLDARASHLFFRLVSHRYERASVVVTTDKPLERWPEFFGDDTVTSAMVDRLAHHAEIIGFEGESYRTRRREGRDKGATDTRDR
ncbi:TIGR00645 family protein [Streptomyces pactum]|uniref:UPF0114 protein IHE55_29580 n=1 Tax=Streptomyces pactum TaxID=68249 RepID=A0ABS0NU27_9ACTN|nr:IS21-like element helper ATPase IstB [Streptomyces pactum]MBH5338707.1 TIGR00645 family protein [Streptomyces pactum]